MPQSRTRLALPQQSRLGGLHDRVPEIGPFGQALGPQARIEQRLGPHQRPFGEVDAAQLLDAFRRAPGADDQEIGFLDQPLGGGHFRVEVLALGGDAGRLGRRALRRRRSQRLEITPQFLGLPDGVITRGAHGAFQLQQVVAQSRQPLVGHVIRIQFLLRHFQGFLPSLGRWRPALGGFVGQGRPGCTQRQANKKGGKR